MLGVEVARRRKTTAPSLCSASGGTRPDCEISTKSARLQLYLILQPGHRNTVNQYQGAKASELSGVGSASLSEHLRVKLRVISLRSTHSAKFPSMQIPLSTVHCTATIGAAIAFRASLATLQPHLTVSRSALLLTMSVLLTTFLKKYCSP